MGCEFFDIEDNSTMHGNMIYDNIIKSQFDGFVKRRNTADMEKVRTGLEQLLASPPAWLSGKRLGLLCNPASVDDRFCHARLRIDRAFPGQLKALFSPQHGFYAEKQDNMVASGNDMDPCLHIPIYSLYGDTRIPHPEMLADIDVLVVDIQDVGARVYTFIYTLSYCMEAAQAHGKKVLVLDRPNPVNGTSVEGNCLTANCRSFVGRFPIPMRHGLTIGEIARLFNEHYGIGCDLEVIPMKGWRRNMFFGDTGIVWVAPSPNMPTPATAMVYPGQVIWEGTNISEGRGTTQPFEIFGAPFLDPRRIASFLKGDDLAGIVLREIAFEPTSGKWQGKLCRGFQIHITDPMQYRPYRTSLKLLQAILFHHPDAFLWKQPPYEYEFEKLPMDMIIGDFNIRFRIEHLEFIDDIEASWQPGLEMFRQVSRRYHLYSR